MNKDLVEGSDPVLSCEEAGQWEHSILDTEEKVWSAMTQVGRSLGRGILTEYKFSRYRPKDLFVVGLIGKGHNGGDALLGIEEMARQGSVGRVLLVLSDSRDKVKPHTAKALGLLEKLIPEKAFYILVCEEGGEEEWAQEMERAIEGQTVDVCLDGLIGMQFRPPLKPGGRKILEFVNGMPNVRLRVGVDLPSGMGDESDDLCFKADVTFATGICKSPLLEEGQSKSIGSIRYLDIGLFEGKVDAQVLALKNSLLDSLRRRRPPHVEKRNYGHLYILAGSRRMPGALIMSVRSALKSGVGRVTVCAPQSIVPVMASLIPEAMWFPWPETPSGGLSSSGLDYIRTMHTGASALLVGPGMGDDPETANMLIELLKRWTGSLVIDADALQPRVMYWIQGVCIATPHLGEFKRIAGLEGTIPNIDRELKAFARDHSIIVALKGPMTRITDGDRVFLNTTGNSVLARGGSGDLLAGLTAGLLAQSPQNALSAACKAVYWHGRAADLLASCQGQVAVCTTELLDFLGDALGMEDGSVDE